MNGLLRRLFSISDAVSLAQAVASGDAPRGRQRMTCLSIYDKQGRPSGRPFVYAAIYFAASK